MEKVRPMMWKIRARLSLILSLEFAHPPLALVDSAAKAQGLPHSCVLLKSHAGQIMPNFSLTWR
jgi:hypothetical protein